MRREGLRRLVSGPLQSGCRWRTPGSAVRVLLWILLSFGAGSPAAAQEPDDETAVIRAVETLFRAMRGADTTALRAAFHPEARLVTTATGDGGPAVRISTVDDFVRSVGESGAVLDETIHDPEVRIDGDLAQLWTRYEIRIDGEFSHCGVDAFHLARTEDGGWVVIGLADTRRREGCVREG